MSRTPGPQTQVERCLSFSTPASPSAARDARRAVANAPNGLEDRFGRDGLLLLTELVNNAVIHGSRGPMDVVSVDFWDLGDRLRVEVRDDGPEFAWREPPDDPGRVTGYGLVLVEAVAERWGIDTSSEQTCVWFAPRGRAGVHGRPAGVAGRAPALGRAPGSRRHGTPCPVHPAAALRTYTQRMPPADGQIASYQLDRRSFVPLYYQLQEVLKEQIESGKWVPGDAMPSEPELAQAFGVSRVVVRQALAILEDDHQIVRIRGRGTFVAQPKLDYRAGGLSRLLTSTRGPDVAIQVLDKRTAAVESSIREGLELNARDKILRITTLLSLRAMPLAISYSFFPADQVPWLDAAAQVGRNLPPTLTVAENGVELADSQLSIEASQCGQFEADRFGIAHRSAVFLVLCTEHRKTADGTAPFEVARVEYRGDVMKFKLQARSGGDGLGATFELDESIEAQLAPTA